MRRGLTFHDLPSFNVIAIQCAMHCNTLLMHADKAILSLLRNTPSGCELPRHRVRCFSADFIANLDIMLRRMHGTLRTMPFAIKAHDADVFMHL